MEPFRADRARRAARSRQRRHRRDHPEAVPQVDQAIGVRPQPVRCVALPRSWRAGEGPARRRKNPDFVLNDPRYQGAQILLARRNFGCGSSREHAPWALGDYGFRALIAPSYADIFFNNCCKNGLLPVVLSEGEVDALFAAVKAFPGFRLTIDLERQTVAAPDGSLEVRLRDRTLPQALSAERARRHRPHARARRRNPRVRGEAVRESRGC